MQLPWVRQAEIDAGTRPGQSSAQRERIVELERENRELRKANQILKQASVSNYRVYGVRKIYHQLRREGPSRWAGTASGA